MKRKSFAGRRKNADAECYGHIRSLVAQTNPDLIFITGDVVYGEFDDSGRSLEQFCAFMNGLCIPWAPVFGNHDNESARGVAWQCDLLESGEYCLFRRGNVTGNGNYGWYIGRRTAVPCSVHDGFQRLRRRDRSRPMPGCGFCAGSGCVAPHTRRGCRSGGQHTRDCCLPHSHVRLSACRPFLRL